MDYENYILDALEMVMAWELPENELADATSQKAKLMAGFNSDDLGECHSDAT